MISVEGITKTFTSGRREVRVLTDVSFRVQQGEALAVKGRSGSGKTTLLYCMAGFEKPDSGRILCMGQDIAALSPGKTAAFLREKTGFVFQQSNLVSYLSVAENIAFPLRLNGAYGGDAEKRVQELLERIEMPDAAKALPKELSGGEALRVAVARALAHQPLVVFADEPTASLDSATAKVIIELLVSISRLQKSTVVFSTHDEEILEIADTVLELRDGRLNA